jgi:hypothetical protein
MITNNMNNNTINNNININTVNISNMTMQQQQQQPAATTNICSNFVNIQKKQTLFSKNTQNEEISLNNHSKLSFIGWAC